MLLYKWPGFMSPYLHLHFLTCNNFIKKRDIIHCWIMSLFLDCKSITIIPILLFPVYQNNTSQVLIPNGSAHFFITKITQNTTATFKGGCLITYY